MARYRETLEDLHRKWGSSYCLVDGRLAMCRELHPSNDGEEILADLVYSYKARGLDAETERRTVVGDSFSPVIIQSGLYNLPLSTLEKQVDEIHMVGCWRMWRRPQRSPQTGASNRTHILRPITEKLLNSPYIRQTNPLNLDTVRAMMNPVYPGWSEAFHQLDDVRAVAVSPQFGICLSNTPDVRNPLLMSFAGVVGYATPQEITVKHPPLFQEVVDFVSRNNLKVRVINAG